MAPNFDPSILLSPPLQGTSSLKWTTTEPVLSLISATIDTCAAYRPVPESPRRSRLESGTSTLRRLTLPSGTSSMCRIDVRKFTSVAARIAENLHQRQLEGLKSCVSARRQGKIARLSSYRETGPEWLHGDDQSFRRIPQSQAHRSFVIGRHVLHHLFCRLRQVIFSGDVSASCSLGQMLQDAIGRLPFDARVHKFTDPLEGSAVDMPTFSNSDAWWSRRLKSTT